MHKHTLYQCPFPSLTQWESITANFWDITLSELGFLNVGLGYTAEVNTLVTVILFPPISVVFTMMYVDQATAQQC